MSFEAVTIERPPAVIIRLRGDLDILTAPQLRSQLLEAVNAVPLIVDLRPLTFIDSTGLSVLVAVSKRAKAMRLIHGSERIHKVFEITGLLSFLDFYDTPTEAIWSPTVKPVSRTKPK